MADETEDTEDFENEAQSYSGAKSPLDRRKRYLQIAFNENASEVLATLPRIPRNGRIIIEAGTPYIKRNGAAGISLIRRMWGGLVLADLKTMDGAEEEVRFAANAGADMATVLGSAPAETLNRFVEACKRNGIMSVIDMIGVEDPLKTVMQLRTEPSVVELHIGRDEETTRGKMLQYRHIKRVLSKFNVFISAAGGVDLKKAQSAAFNGANIVVVNMVPAHDSIAGIRSGEDIAEIAEKFLQTIE
ncbi:MAG: orotidine 5'-phosphate decarboxylase / HUMPS family protein [Candidatus Micrarchaeia archaeon]